MILYLFRLLEKAHRGIYLARTYKYIILPMADEWWLFYIIIIFVSDLWQRAIARMRTQLATKVLTFYVSTKKNDIFFEKGNEWRRVRTLRVV